jgi:hypothetical protein
LIQQLSRHSLANFWRLCPLTPNASNSRLNSVALALRSAQRGAPGGIVLAGLVSLGFSHQIEAVKTFSERGIANVTGRVSMMAQDLSSAGEVRNGSSRIKLGVCLRGVGYQGSAPLVGFK